MTTIENYQCVEFSRPGSEDVEDGIYLDACTNQNGDFLPQRIVVITGRQFGVREVIPRSQVDSLKARC